MDAKETIAKAVGKVKKAGATLTGDAPIFKRLKEEHGQVSGLMMQMKAGSEDTCRELFPKLRRELLAHARAEEQEFYPVLERYDEVRTEAVTISHGHEDIKLLLQQLETLPFGTKEWDNTFDRVRETVQEHVDQEEKVLFPRAEEVLSEEQAKDMERRFIEVREREARKLDEIPFTPGAATEAETTGHVRT